MAEIIGSTNNPLWTFKFQIYEMEVNEINNYSIVRVDLYIGRASSRYYIGGNYSGTVIVDGQQQDFNGNIPYPTYINGGEWAYIGATRDFKVYHDSDGAKTVKANASVSSNDFTPSYCSAEGDFTLTTIPRKTSCPNFTGTIRNSYTYSISPASDSFTHSLKLVFGSYTWWLQSNGWWGSSEWKFSGKSRTLNVPTECYSQFAGQYGLGTLTLYTYSGNTEVGSDTGSFRAECSASYCTPSISATVKDINNLTKNLTSDDNYIVKYISNVLITPSIRASDSADTVATVSSKTINGVAFSGSTYTINKADSKSFTLKVTNSRGYSKEVTVSATGDLINYVPLTWSGKVTRPQPTTGEAVLSGSGNYFNGKFKNTANTLTMQWYWKERDAGSWTFGGNIGPSISGNRVNVSSLNLGNRYEYTKNYKILVNYSDKISSYSVEYDLFRGIPIFWWEQHGFHVSENLCLDGVMRFHDVWSTGKAFLVIPETYATLIDDYYLIADLGTNSDANASMIRLIGYGGAWTSRVSFDISFSARGIKGDGIYYGDFAGWNKFEVVAFQDADAHIRLYYHRKEGYYHAQTFVEVQFTKVQEVDCSGVSLGVPSGTKVKTFDHNINMTKIG